MYANREEKERKKEREKEKVIDVYIVALLINETSWLISNESFIMSMYHYDFYIKEK
jgi:hypothetical protein